MAEVAEELAQKEAAEAAKKEMRFWETTNGAIHDKKDLTMNVVGKRQMITQDGATVDGMDE